MDFKNHFFWGAAVRFSVVFFHSPFPEEMFALEATTVTPLPGNHSILGLGLFLFLAVYSGWLTFSPNFLFGFIG